jgi:hypothetical protein
MYPTPIFELNVAHMDIVNTSAPIDQLAHIRELAKDSPFNNGLVTLGMAADPPTVEMVELAQFVSLLSRRLTEV